MIKGIGIDLISIDRIRKAERQWGERFLKRVFSDLERARAPRSSSRWQYLASRFSAKEAFFKALGTGIAKGFGFKDVMVVNEDSGRPRILVSDKVKKDLDSQGIRRIHLSISHEGGAAVTMVILES